MSFGLLRTPRLVPLLMLLMLMAGAVSQSHAQRRRSRFPPQVYGRPQEPKPDTPKVQPPPKPAPRPVNQPGEAYQPDSNTRKLIAAGSGPPIRDLKLLDEYPDGKGNTVRIVRYKQGGMIVTETLIMPKPVKMPPMMPVSLDTVDPRFVEIVVEKSKYQVVVMYRKRPIRRYKAVFGPKPLVDKCMEGDRCTPEGGFTIVNKNPGSKYTKFMGISYPNDSSYARFNARKAAGSIPASASIGGNVGIHGIWPGGDDLIDMGIGWTDGCVAICNRDIEELYTITGVGTKVLIRK